MQNSMNLEINPVDLEAIEREARQLRAQALRGWLLSVKNLFAKAVQGTGGRHIEA